jgi:hypothetical protein
MFLPGLAQLKKIQFLFLFLLCSIQKIRRRSLDDVTKNLVFVVTRLRNHEKYSPCRIYFMRDGIVNSLMEQ